MKKLGMHVIALSWKDEVFFSLRCFAFRMTRKLYANGKSSWKWGHPKALVFEVRTKQKSKVFITYNKWYVTCPTEVSLTLNVLWLCNSLIEKAKRKNKWEMIVGPYSPYSHMWVVKVPRVGMNSTKSFSTW